MTSQPRLVGILAIMMVFAGSAPAWAVDTGDILATDGWHGLLYAERVNGNLHRFGSSAAVADGLNGVVSDANGNIYALLAYAGEVFQVNAATGEYTTVTSGGFLAYPNAICLLPNGDLLVSDHGLSGGVVRVNPSSSAQTLAYNGQVYAVTASAGGVVHVVIPDPNRTVNPACRIYQLDPPPGGPETCMGLLFRINPVTGAQTVISEDSYWRLGGIDIYRGPHVTTPTLGVTWGRIKTMYR